MFVSEDEIRKCNVSCARDTCYSSYIHMAASGVEYVLVTHYHSIIVLDYVSEVTSASLDKWTTGLPPFLFIQNKEV